MSSVTVKGSLQPINKPQVEVPVEENHDLDQIQAPKEAQLEKSPKSLNGSELAAIAIFRTAEQMAMIMENNHRFGEALGYPNARFNVRVEINIEYDTPTGAVNSHKVMFETQKIDVRVHPAMPELLRVEAGLGLWHRMPSADGRFNHIQARPTKKVMEHLLKIITDNDLGKASGLKSGLNKD